MRNAIAQHGMEYGPRMCCTATMQPACLTCANHDGQRWALLTTKSRNTCTRATVFNSSG